MINLKQKYIKPDIVVFGLDSEVSLQMGSENGPPPDPWGRSAAPPEVNPGAPVQPNPFEPNPFSD